MTFIKRILKLSPKEKKTIDERFMKLNEEIGEIAIAILQSRGLKHTNKSKKEIKENILEEICDSIIVLLSMAGYFKYTDRQIKIMIHKKLDKWEERII
jgi:NTP pyrophosphatase (non-canonical NTP hydrolase)